MTITLSWVVDCTFPLLQTKGLVSKTHLYITSRLTNQAPAQVWVRTTCLHLGYHTYYAYILVQLALNLGKIPSEGLLAVCITQSILACITIPTLG